MKNNIIIIRAALWLLLAATAGWFAYLRIVPGRKISYVYDFSKPSFFIGKLAPAERVEVNQAEAVVRGDPVYFSLRPPRRFEKAGVTVKFKNTAAWPVMEIGLLNDKVAWGYDLKPLQNKIIDQLAMVWPAVQGPGGERLIQREKKYGTVEEFLNNPPPAAEIALYDYNFKNKFILPKYAPGAEGRPIDCRLRGSYQFYTYVKNEELDYVFDFIDLNANKDNDPVDIKVYSPDGLIYVKHIADDASASPERRANFKIPGLPEGVYRLSFIANDDIITKTIASRQSQFALINKAWLADGNKKNLVLYTNSRSVSAQTVNPASRGIIKVGESALDLNETYKQITLKTASRPGAETLADKPVKIELAKDDIIISGDGVFSFDENGVLDPRLKNITGDADINREKINYILTGYKGPLEDGEWRTATAEFDLTKAYKENGKYQFLISIPGLKAEEAGAGAVIIKEIKVDLSGTSLRQKINKYFGWQ